MVYIDTAAQREIEMHSHVVQSEKPICRVHRCMSTGDDANRYSCVG